MTFDIRQTFDRRQLDKQAVGTYVATLFGLFVESIEARALEGDDDDDFDGLTWSSAMMHYGVERYGVTPVDMTQAQFEDIVFQAIPHGYACDDWMAEGIIEELRGFWKFLGRQYSLANASECLAVLDQAATDRLRNAIVAAHPEQDKEWACDD